METCLGISEFMGSQMKDLKSNYHKNKTSNFSLFLLGNLAKILIRAALVISEVKDLSNGSTLG